MILDAHMKRSKILFGKEYKEVHEWLDDFALMYGRDHRVYRHNMRGVQWIVKKYGAEAGKVAMLHILDDGYEDIPQ